MTLAYWPAMGGGPSSLLEVAPVLADRGIVTSTIDPRYAEREEWALDVLAAELSATGADTYAGSSWGAATSCSKDSTA